VTSNETHQGSKDSGCRLASQKDTMKHKTKRRKKLTQGFVDYINFQNHKEIFLNNPWLPYLK